MQSVTISFIETKQRYSFKVISESPSFFSSHFKEIQLYFGWLLGVKTELLITTEPIVGC